MTNRSIPEPLPLQSDNGYQRRRRRTRQQLVEAATELFVERGVENVSIDAITNLAGVAKGSFYNHFESREALFEELIEATVRDLFVRREAYQPPIDDPLELALARTWFAYYSLLSDTTACRLLLQSGSPSAGGPIDRVMRMALGDQLMDGVAQGGLRHLDPELVYAAYFGVVTQAIGHLLAREEPLDRVSAADQLTELCFAILGLPHHRPQHVLTEEATRAVGHAPGG